MPNQNLSYFPKSLSNKAIATYVISLLAVSVLFMQYALPLWLMLFGIISIIVFFHFSNTLSVQWMKLTSKAFEKKLFWMAFLIRLVYVIFIYNLNYELYGTYYESNEGDINWYVPIAEYLSQMFQDGLLTIDVINSNIPNFSDGGYPVYLTILYTLTFGMSTVILPLIIKAFIGALTCVYIYKISNNHFSESVSRIAAVFCMLQFNLIWWCGSMMKDTELIFLFIWFACRVDTLLIKQDFNAISWSITIAIGMLLFAFRTVLALIAFFSLFLSLVFTSSKVISVSKKIIAGVFMSIMILIFAGGKIVEESKELIETAADTSYQRRNMEWRSQRKGSGNQFAKYAGAAVFAPLIFTIPFPSMVYTYHDQEMQNMVAGGNYVKNILSFFVIYVMFFLLFSGEWRKHVFPIALLIGYLASLVVSVFAQSGRFHMPIIPLEMMFAAYGLSLVAEKRRLNWFNYVLIVEFMFCVAWSWFKLRGRNMI